MTFTHHARLHPTRATHQLRAPHFSNHRPLHGLSSCRARYATAAPFSKADIPLVQPNPACRAAPAGHTASLPSGLGTSDQGLPGVALSDSDEEDADLLDVLSDGRSDADEAVTGYLQEGSADTVLAKSKTETREQVTTRLMVTVAYGPCSYQLLCNLTELQCKSCIDQADRSEGSCRQATDLPGDMHTCIAIWMQKAVVTALQDNFLGLH